MKRASTANFAIGALFLKSFTNSNDLVKIIALSNNMHIIKMKIEKANKLLGEAPT